VPILASVEDSEAGYVEVIRVLGQAVAYRIEAEKEGQRNLEKIPKKRETVNR